MARRRAGGIDVRTPDPMLRNDHIIPPLVGKVYEAFDLDIGDT